jgi:energy-coupling factor transporter ATP-binding protein EcfA2
MKRLEHLSQRTLIIGNSGSGKSALSDSAESSVPAVIGAKEPYLSGIAEIMIMTQIRHAKLWLAGDVRNWDLADYQIDDLKEGLEDVVKHFPQYKDMPVGQMIETIITTPIAEVEKAIKSRDRAKFVSTFDKLTDACNTCRQAANRAFIVVQRPAASPFPNQSFAPKRN